MPLPPAPAVIGVLGLGEAGGEMAHNLLEAGATVRAYDPKVEAPPGAVACSNEADAASVPMSFSTSTALTMRRSR
jgi:3-hydroxyisobutyrate dehydrogenase-like beta-hydroxyacid dehydrogenase